MKEVVDAFLSLVIVLTGSWVVIYVALGLVELLPRRSGGAPVPYGVHGMPADHPEQVPADLTDDELATFMELVSKWDRP